MQRPSGILRDKPRSIKRHHSRGVRGLMLGLLQHVSSLSPVADLLMTLYPTLLKEVLHIHDHC